MARTRFKRYWIRFSSSDLDLIDNYSSYSVRIVDFIQKIYSTIASIISKLVSCTDSKIISTITSKITKKFSLISSKRFKDHFTNQSNPLHFQTSHQDLSSPIYHRNFHISLFFLWIIYKWTSSSHSLKSMLIYLNTNLTFHRQCLFRNYFSSRAI
jgi:hypothetical protein